MISNNVRQDMSLYIPVVFNNICAVDIKNILERYDFGVVDRIDFIARTNKYSSARVYFKKWASTTTMERFQKRIKEKGASRIIYDDPSYWIACENIRFKDVAGLDVDMEFVEESYDFVDRDYIVLLEKEILKNSDSGDLLDVGIKDRDGLVDSSYATKLERILSNMQSVK